MSNRTGEVRCCLVFFACDGRMLTLHQRNAA